MRQSNTTAGAPRPKSTESQQDQESKRAARRERVQEHVVGRFVIEVRKCSRQLHGFEAWKFGSKRLRTEARERPRGCHSQRVLPKQQACASTRIFERPVQARSQLQTGRRVEKQRQGRQTREASYHGAGSNPIALYSREHDSAQQQT